MDGVIIGSMSDIQQLWNCQRRLSRGWREIYSAQGSKHTGLAARRLAAKVGAPILG